jgi:hypothetical protein
VLNKLTILKNPGKVGEYRETIDGVILNAGPHEIMVYIIPAELIVVFEAQVNEWQMALTSGRTQLPINLFYGRSFDRFDKYITPLPHKAIGEVQGPVYRITDYFCADSPKRRRVKFEKDPNTVTLLKGRPSDTLEQFKAKARARYGDKYSFEKSDYKDSHTNITITCPEHGDFERQPCLFICRGSACPQCVKEQKKVSRRRRREARKVVSQQALD